MVEVAADGRLLSDGTPVMDPDMAKAIPRINTKDPEIRRASREALQPITDGERERLALDRRVRFDLPLGSFEQLKATSEILASLALVLEGMSYMRQKKEAHVIGEARRRVGDFKRKLANV